MDNTGLKNITKMYEKLNYFDQYGGSVILFIIITIILILITSYCFIMINVQPVIDDWTNQRCKPTIIPFAGFITHPEGVSAADYTYQNFTYCTQNILSSITGYAVEPLSFTTSLLNNMAKQVETNLQSVRGMFSKVRSMFEDISKEIMGRIMNFTIPLQQIIISFKDLIGKIQGTMTAGLFTLLGSYYTLKALMGAIAQFIITILIALAVMIAVFWIIPFTWGAAIANTAIFVAISIPLIIILVFMTEVLHVQTSFSMPKLKAPSMKCFDKDTLITMSDYTKKRIVDVCPGDILIDNNTVTAIFKVETNGSHMYKLGDITVSDSHIVRENNKWVHVYQHTNAVKLDDYVEPRLYCLNTSDKTIMIDEYIFADWDDIYDNYITELQNNHICKISDKQSIHTFLEGGIEGSTRIKLKNGEYKEIKDIEVGAILLNGEKVYGIVKIDGRTVNEQYRYNLGKKLVVEGGPNLAICDKKVSDSTTLTLDDRNKKILDKKHPLLYHLLTDKQTFTIGDIQFYDYNASIDLFLEKSRGKLLSMKYV